MSKQSVVTAIDLGTEKCVTLIAAIDEETKHLHVVGVSAVTSRGVKKSTIVDLEAVLMTLTESIDAAERMAGFSIKSAYVSISGSHIESLNSKGVVAVAAPNHEIAKEDVMRVIEAARAISLPSDRSVIHVIPRDYKVDSQPGIKDPIGMTGIRLESEAHIITGMTTAMRNIEKSMNDVGIEIDGFVFAGLASAESCLTETEKELGVAAVDIGSGSTSLCVYVEGSLEYSATIPIGARHITQDIALGCRISLENAEKIKTALSEEYASEMRPMPGESKDDVAKRKKKEDQLDLDALGIQESVQVLSKKTIVEGIMQPRMKEIFRLVGEKLENKELFSLIPAGVVLTGGGAETVDMTEVAKKTLRLPARVSQPEQLQGLTSDIMKPSFAVGVGMLKYGYKRGGTSVGSASLDFGKMLTNLNMGSFFKNIVSFIRSLIP